MAARDDAPPPKLRKLSVIVPVFNERNTVVEIVRRMRAVELPEDRARDHRRRRRQHRRHPRRAPPARRQHGARRLARRRTAGKGAAIRTGLEHVTGDLVLVQDADLEYDPEDWPKLLAPVLRGQGAGRLRLALHRRAPQHAVPALGRQPVPVARHQRALQHDALRHGDVLQALRPRRARRASRCGRDRFDFEPEITAKILRRGIRIYEVPISYTGREFDEGKKITWRDGFAALVDPRQVPLRRLTRARATSRRRAGPRSSSTTRPGRCSPRACGRCSPTTSAGRRRARRRRQRLARRLGRRAARARSRRARDRRRARQPRVRARPRTSASPRPRAPVVAVLNPDLERRAGHRGGDARRASTPSPTSRRVGPRSRTPTARDYPSARTLAVASRDAVGHALLGLWWPDEPLHPPLPPARRRSGAAPRRRLGLGRGGLAAARRARRGRRLGRALLHVHGGRRPLLAAPAARLAGRLRARRRASCTSRARAPTGARTA